MKKEKTLKPNSFTFKKFFKLLYTFFKIGLFTFGGGYAMLSLIEEECVLKNKWISYDEYSDILAIAETTPGPISINMATFCGYKVCGVFGSLGATLGVISPSIVIIFLISLFFEDLLENTLIVAIFKGIRVAVAFLIAKAGFNILINYFKSEKRKVIPSIFIIVFFTISILLTLFDINFSTIYLIIISGFLGFVIFGFLRPLMEKRK
ncbi:MAG TPA: chromate transporter [Candidatus Onthovivens sp.]|nr:chromate transporter [Candidatus Onthovivens sp.]